MSELQHARESICEIGRRLWQAGMCGGNGGNLSIRLRDNRIVSTPTNVSKGFMQPDDLCIVDLDGQQMSGRLSVTSEVKLHLEIYRNRSDVHAVVHAHAPYLTAYAVSEMAVPAGILAEMDVVVGPIPLLPYALPGSVELAQSIRGCINHATTALLSHHGALSWAATLEQAWFRFEVAEHYCHMLTIAKQIGGPKMLSQSDLAALLKSKRDMGLFDDPRVRP